MKEYRLNISPAIPKFNLDQMGQHSTQATTAKKEFANSRSAKPFRDDKIMDANDHQDYGDQQDLEDQDMQLTPQFEDFEESPNNANPEFFEKEPNSDIVD